MLKLHKGCKIWPNIHILHGGQLCLNGDICPVFSPWPRCLSDNILVFTQQRGIYHTDKVKFRLGVYVWIR